MWCILLKKNGPNIQYIKCEYNTIYGAISRLNRVAPDSGNVVERKEVLRITEGLYEFSLKPELVAAE